MCSDNNLVIKVTSLGKCYNIYNKPADRLKQSVIPKIQHLFNRPVKSYYHEFWALQNINLDVRKGETVGIIGRNGSGKSTLLQLICKTLTPTTGSLETNGRITALLELGSGFNPEFTGRENVFLNGAILGLSQDEISDRFEAIAKFADIGEFIEQPVKFYSSGMTVRLAFAVQAMVDPDILIVDEALAVGDERFQRKCFRRLEELKDNGTSILFVSHSGPQVVELCDRALLLEQGQCLLLSDPTTVVRSYQKMLYASPEEQIRLVQEFRELKSNNEIGSNISLATHPEKPGDLQSDPVVNTDIYETDFYESNMIPQSTVSYEIQGARVDSIKIYNMEGQQVNNLLSGKNYNFEICGTFLEEREAIYLGFHIRTMTGIEITGPVYPSVGKYIYGVKPSQRYKLVYKMQMKLTPNTYFAGTGIWSPTEPACLHRIIDAIMFRVLPKAANQPFGYVDLSAGKPEFEIIKT